MADIVLLHGLIGGLDEPELLDALRDHVVSAPELPGYGGRTGEPATIEAQVSALSDLLPDGRSGWLVGHSLGCVVANRFAALHPDRVAGIVNVEGNFTLRDAAWTSQLATRSLIDIAAQLAADQADPAGWLHGVGVVPSPSTTGAAARALAFQDAATLRSIAASTVAETTDPRYLDDLRRTFAARPVHLIAGSRSRPDWDVPDWALSRAASYTEIADAGHLVPLERPAELGRLIAHLIGHGPSVGA